MEVLRWEFPVVRDVFLMESRLETRARSICEIYDTVMILRGLTGWIEGL